MYNKFPLWVSTLSVFVSLTVIRKIFERANFALNNFNDRIIGLATLEAIDISSRSLLYFKIIFVWIFIILACLFAYHYLFNIKKKEINKIDRFILLYLSLFGIFSTIYHYINGAEIFAQIINVINFLTLIYLGFSAVKFIKINRRINGISAFLSNYNLVVASFLIPLSIFFIKWGLFGGGFILTKMYYIYYLGIWLSYWAFLFSYFYFVHKKDYLKKLTSILVSLIPLLTIPLSIPVLNEFQYTISSVNDWNISLILKLGILLQLGIAGLLFVFNKSVLSRFKFAKYIYLPLLIITVSVFNLRQNFIDVINLDTFHHGENLISTQQLFQFGKIPFLDIFPTHGLSYMLGQTLYSLANGYAQFQPWIWEWVSKTFEITLFYFVLATITNSFFAAGSLLFLPIIGIFGGQTMTYGILKDLPTTYYFAAFLPGLLLANLFKSKSSRYGKLWLGCMFLFAWRVDFGIAGFIATLFLITFENYNRAKNLPIFIATIKKVGKSLLVTILIALIPLSIVFVNSNTPIFESLSQLIMFAKFQAQAQGLLTLATSLSFITLMQYLFLPVVATIYIIWYISHVFTSNKFPTPSYKLPLVYLAVFSLIISIRSFQRQTLSVLGYNPYLFVFLLLTLPILISKTKRHVNTVFFLTGLLVYQLVLPNGAFLLKSGTLVNLQNWQTKEIRVRVNDTQYKTISEFLKNNLKNDETFLDLTSTPLLYVVTNKEFINYLVPNAYITSEIIQIHTLENIKSSHQDGRLPIVIFRQPVDGANNIDGVPNEVRSYRIYEYIYSNYQPAGTIEGYSVWTAKDYQLRDLTNLTPDKKTVQTFRLKNIPRVWASYDQFNAKEKTLILADLVDKPLEVSQKPLIIKLPSEINKDKGNYLHIKASAPAKIELTITYGQNPISSLTFDLVASENPVDYMVRISSQYYWTTSMVAEIKLNTTGNAIIDDLLIRQGD